MIKADAGRRRPRGAGRRCRSSFDFAAEQDGVTVTSPYDNPQQISQDGTIAFAQLDVARPQLRPRSPTSATTIEDFGDEQHDVDGLQIEYGGDLFGEFELPESEILGIIAAVIILILAFGSVLAMGLPIGTALFGLGIGSALVVARSATSSRCPTSRRRWWR